MLFLIANTNGTATPPLPIPNDPSLQLLTLFAEGAVLAPGANGLGALFTNGLAARIP